MIKKIRLYYNTLIHLKWQQFWYRIPVLKKIGLKISNEPLDMEKAGKTVSWINSIPAFSSFSNSSTFSFLNISHDFNNYIDWDYSKYGLLWTYNLNYFEFLLQENMNQETGLILIDNFLGKYEQLKTAHDPYPTSLRIIFWTKFFLINQIVPPEKYLAAILNQAKELQGKLEYHLLGNHLLENAFALYFAGLYLNDHNISKSAIKLLIEQLDEQVLEDGAHFELSPMYHSIILYRLLDCINLGKGYYDRIQPEILDFLIQKAGLMLGWFQQISFKSGYFPLFNDAAYGIAPKFPEVIAYANRLKIQVIKKTLKDSGYRKWQHGNFEIIMDVGSIGPSYQAGHSHSDTLSFVLNYNNIPYFVEMGTSTYEKGKRRNIERGTIGHNTVSVNGLNQSEVWGGFRVGRRANTVIISESDFYIEATHDGYREFGIMHNRKFSYINDQFIIEDSLNGYEGFGVAYFHFHPDVQLKQNDSLNFLLDNKLVLNFYGKNIEVIMDKFQFSNSFNKYLQSIRLKVVFKANYLLKIKPCE